MPKKFKSRSQGKKNRKLQSRKDKDAAEQSQLAGPPIPKSFVFRKGFVGSSVRDLVLELRRLMEPNTATNLKERKSNTIKDFKTTAIEMGVTHLIALTTSENTGSTFLRVGRVPHGPTVSFKVNQFSLGTDVQRMLNRGGRVRPPGSEYSVSPLVVLNGFVSTTANPLDSEKEKALKLVSVTLQNMFPSINIESIKLRDCRRVVLFNYNSDTDTISFRHYLITATPTGMNRSIRRVITGRAISVSNPKVLHNAEDVADVILGNHALSDSEVSDMEECKVALPQDFRGKGNVAAGSAADRSTVRLVELGPRMELSLVRVQEKLFEGEVLMGPKTQFQKIQKGKKGKDKKGKGKGEKVVNENGMEEDDDDELDDDMDFDGIYEDDLEENVEVDAGNDVDSDEDDDDVDDDDKWYEKEVGEAPEKSFNTNNNNGKKRARKEGKKEDIEIKPKSKKAKK